MSNFSFKLFDLAMKASTIVSNDDGKWAKLQEVIGKLIPILWIATAIVSTVWMVIKFVSANFQSATGDQGKYEQAKKARKRALFAWITGLLWPVFFLVAWPIAQMIFTAVNPDAAEDFPPLF